MVISQVSLLESVAHQTEEMKKQRFDRFFLNPSQESVDFYQKALSLAQEAIIEQFSNQEQPYSGWSHQDLVKLFDQRFEEILPEYEAPIEMLFKNISEVMLQHSIVVTNPKCLAHLHCPPLNSALAAEVMISATNQSMDSWDQSAAATILEEKMTEWLSSLYFNSNRADGVFTSGGTQSNLMGLLLARDHYLKHQLNWNAQKDGLPPEASKLRILCSKAAHFTVRQSAFLLGLGDQAVVPIEIDNEQRMCVHHLDRCLEEMRQNDLLPFAVVATAGTTDFGSIDPLIEIAKRAQDGHMWFHIDAAYGGALFLSNRYKHKLEGMELADSITVDFHKLFYQPISCGAFLVKDRTNFEFIKLNADYLNPEDDEETGIPNLVTKSIQTTRRFDALKLFVTFHTLGRQQLAEMIEYTIELAQETAVIIERDHDFELINRPEMNAVVFRYKPHEIKRPNDTEWLNRMNSYIRKELLDSGEVVLARTRVNQSVYLKFTLLNPRTTVEDIQSILRQIKAIAQKVANI